MPHTRIGTEKPRSSVTPTTHKTAAARPSPVLAAEPLRHLLTTFDQRLATIMHLAPNSDLASTMAVCRADLYAAIRQASDNSYVLTVAEVAARLRMSEEAVRWNIRNGYLDASTAGREYRITRDALEHFVSATQNPNRATR